MEEDARASTGSSSSGGVRFHEKPLPAALLFFLPTRYSLTFGALAWPSWPKDDLFER
jgi:hypothetical protein